MQNDSHGRAARLLIPAAWLAVGVLHVDAQTLLHRFDGSTSLDELGSSVGGGADVDADGVPDVVVGVPFSDVMGPNAGAARVYSGLSGALIHEFAVGQAHAHFGGAVACVDDLDGDGHAELLVGAEHYDFGGTDCGAAFVKSGKTGATMALFGGS